MKFGEVYGAISSRLNKGIVYINTKIIEDEVEASDDDIEEVVVHLWEKGLARRINSTEYELVCDIGQLRDFIINKENEGRSVADKGEYDDCADKPISLQSIQDSSWRLLEKPDKSNTRAPQSPFERFQQSRRNRPRPSIFDDDDEDEDNEEKKERIKGYLREANNYNEENRTLEPDMRALFPDSDTPLVLEWREDSDGDLYLTDGGCLFNYLLSKMIDKECECTKNLIELLLANLEKKSSFGRDGEKMINYLTSIDDRDRLRIEINYFAIQYGKYIKSLSWLLTPVKNGTDDPKKDLDDKIEAFVNEFKESTAPSLFEAMSAVGMARMYIRKIQLIDPRITKEQAVSVANRMKDKLLNDKAPTVFVQAINEAITQLNVITDRVYNLQKIDIYTAEEQD